jgi:hypothetical protein
MTIYVYGDATEAAKYRSTVEHYLSEMTRTFGKTSQSYWRQLSDTAKVHLRLINGQPFAYLYVEEVLQGFVIGLQNSSILPEGFETWTLATLLQDVENVWSMKKQPYHYGNKPIPSALPYSINPSNAVIFTYKNLIYKAIKAWIPPNETPSTYLDGEPLYLDDNTLFLHRDKTVVPVINSLVEPIGWQSHDDLKYEWTDASLVADLHLGMLVTLWRYDSPPIVKHVGNTLEFYFLMMNETIAFTVQRYQATLRASNNNPYLTLSTPTSLVQEWALGEFTQTAGRSYTTGSNPVTPIGGLDEHGLCVWHKADGPEELWSVTGFAGAGCYATSSNYTNYTYAANGSNEATIALNSGLEFIVKRDMEATASGEGGSTNFYGTNDTGETIWRGNINVTDRTHGYIPTSSDNTGTLPDEPIGNAGASEGGELLTANSDSASTSIKCEQLPADVQKTTHTGTRSGQSIESYKYTKGYPTPSTDVNWGGDYRMTLYTYAPTESTIQTIIRNSSHTVNTTVEARDYIYCDLEEQVFIYIELDATGTYANGVGSSEVAIRFCLNYRGHVFKQDIYSYTMDSSIFVNTKNPDDVNFGTAATEVRFTVPSPYMPKLIFAPKWTTQNQCPYIAYRTLAEIGTLDKNGNTIPDEMLFTMRFQLYRERRELDDSPFLPTEAIVPPEGTVTLKVPTIEHTTRTHGFQVKSLFDNLELLWPTVSFSIPDSTDWLADVLPVDWPRPISDDDEPTTGIFTKNSGDLSTWNIYRT